MHRRLAGIKKRCGYRLGVRDERAAEERLLLFFLYLFIYLFLICTVSVTPVSFTQRRYCPNKLRLSERNEYLNGGRALHY